MSKIVRILGKRERITIPYEIRREMKICCGDILSFSAEDNTITVVKEKLCDNCKSDEPMEEFVKALEADERERLLHILKREKKRRRSCR